MFEYGVSPLLEAMNDYLGIGTRPKDMAMTFELAPQLLKIVDFTIEYHPDGAVGMPHGLVSARKIDDGKSAKTETEVT
jgi:hypothetical protein